MLLPRYKRERLTFGGGLLLGVALLSLINAGVVFGSPAKTRVIRLANYRVGQVTPFGGAPVSVEQAAPAAPSGPYNVEGASSISADKINEVLASFSSPAAGLGQTFIDLGAKYNINPAYALAFYIHESAAGTKGVARFTKGIGNIRTTPGYSDYEGYRSYDSYEQGIEDWYKLIRELYIDGWGLRSVDQILPRYAPPQDNNDTGAYIANVESLVDSWR